MTPRELNKDIKRLIKQITKSRKEMRGDKFVELLDTKYAPEFRRLHAVDIKLEYVNRANLVSMMTLNRSFGIIHRSGFFCGSKVQY